MTGPFQLATPSMRAGGPNSRSTSARFHSPGTMRLKSRSARTWSRGVPGGMSATPKADAQPTASSAAATVAQTDFIILDSTRSAAMGSATVHSPGNGWKAVYQLVERDRRAHAGRVVDGVGNDRADAAEAQLAHALAQGAVLVPAVRGQRRD